MYQKRVTIHESGSGADKIEIISYGNGAAYEIQFGEASAPMGTLFFQDESAAELKADFDWMEACGDFTQRQSWLAVLDKYGVI